MPRGNATDPEDEVPIASVGRTRGRRGEVVLHPYFDLRGEDLAGAELTCVLPGGERRILRIERLWWHNERTICSFQECRSADEASALTLGELLARRADLTPLDEEEYFIADLLGCRVLLRGGAELGVVRRVESSGGATLLEVSGDKEYLLPLAREIVVEIDLGNGTLVVDPPEGLLDLN